MNRSTTRLSQAIKGLCIKSSTLSKSSHQSWRSNVFPAIASCPGKRAVTLGLQNALWQPKQCYTTSTTTPSTAEPTMVANEVALGDCPGCGAPFQKSDPAQPGYVAERKAPSSINKKKQQNKSLNEEAYQAALDELDPETRALLEGESIESQAGQHQSKQQQHQHNERSVCQRCYALQHHNASTTSSTPDFLRSSQQFGSLDFLKTKRDPLMVAVFDVTDLPASMGHLPQLLQQNPGARILLAANKMDLLPASARRHEQRIRDWILQHMKSIGVPTQQVVSVTLISAKKGWGIPTLMRKMDRERLPTDDIYLVGSTNVGKSALVNQFMSQIRGTLDAEGRRLKSQLKAQYKITSSAVPGTTMGTIKVPLHALGMTSDDGEGEGWEKRRFVTRDRFLIDTPGIINDQQLIHQLDYEEQKKLVNQKEMSPVTFKLEPGKSLLLKPLVRIDLLESDHPVLFTMFSPLAPHLTKTDKLPAAHALQDRNTHLRPVKDQSILRMSSLEPMDEIVRVRGMHRSHATVDFSFAGVGWVSLIGEFERATFRIWLPKDVDSHKVFTMRDPPFLPYEYKGSIRKFFGSGERTRK
ncbi:GTPase [Mucor ambiguus]|uniref:GTPase n=1 Tax=Mucor ambiguus TaxID=91626 RepID=A0A0C9MW15_9FUNG|nr:GTPase [Mucor ambiguus]